MLELHLLFPNQLTLMFVVLGILLVGIGFGFLTKVKKFTAAQMEYVRRSCFDYRSNPFGNGALGICFLHRPRCPVFFLIQLSIYIKQLYSYKKGTMLDLQRRNLNQARAINQMRCTVGTVHFSTLSDFTITFTA